jgi:hypothetical protein
MRQNLSTLRAAALGVAAIGLVAIAGAGPAHAQGAQPRPLPPGEGRDLLATACTQCHNLSIIVSMRDGAPGWRRHVYNMVTRGAQLTSSEAEAVIGYLAANFGPSSAPVAAAPATAASVTASPATISSASQWRNAREGTGPRSSPTWSVAAQSRAPTRRRRSRPISRRTSAPSDRGAGIRMNEPHPARVMPSGASVARWERHIRAQRVNHS